MAKAVKNKKEEKMTKTLGRSAVSGRFVDNLTRPQGTTAEALDILESIRLTPRERDEMLRSLDSHERLAGSPQ